MVANASSPAIHISHLRKISWTMAFNSLTSKVETLFDQNGINVYKERQVGQDSFLIGNWPQ